MKHKFRHHFLPFVVAAALVNPAARAQTTGLPGLGDGEGISLGAERQLGDRIARELYRDPDYLEDPVLDEYIQLLWAPLIRAAAARGELSPELQERFAWRILLGRDRSVNAFALPGGYLGVHLGLIAVVGSHDELASVLAHELSHVSQRHIARGMSEQARSTPLLIGAMILGALAASKNPQSAQALIVGGQAAAIQSQLSYSRDMEREADRVGYGILVDAGYDPRGFVGMFGKLQQAAGLNDNGAFPYLRSHPLTTQRIAEVQARLQLASTETPPANPASQLAAANARALHGMMAARAKVLADPGVDVLRALLVQAQITSGQSINNAGALYAGALAAAKLRDFAAAQALAEKVIAITQGDPQAQSQAVLLQIDVDLLSGRVPPSLKTIDISKTKVRAELLTQSRALLASGRPRDVSERLSTWVTDHPKDSGAWQLLAVAYGNQGQTVRAIRADAESHAARLDYPAALDRLKAAQDIIRSNPASSDFMEGSIIDTRTRQVQSLVKEQALQDKIDR